MYILIFDEIIEITVNHTQRKVF